MHRSLVAIVSVLALSASWSALAQSTESVPEANQSVPAANQKTAAVPPSQVVCAYVYHEGMIIGRSCRTKRQMDNTRFQTQKELSDIQLLSLTGGHN